MIYSQMLTVGSIPSYSSLNVISSKMLKILGYRYEDRIPIGLWVDFFRKKVLVIGRTIRLSI